MSSISLLRSGLVTAVTVASLSAAAAAPVFPNIEPAVAGGAEKPILVWGGGRWRGGWGGGQWRRGGWGGGHWGHGWRHGGGGWGGWGSGFALGLGLGLPLGYYGGGYAPYYGGYAPYYGGYDPGYYDVPVYRPRYYHGYGSYYRQHYGRYNGW